MQLASDVPEAPAAAPSIMHKQYASKAYKTSSYHGISDRETMAEAFRIMISHLYNAKDAHAQHKPELMLEFNVKTLSIITLLASGIETGTALSDKDARAGALFMANLYNDVFIRLTNIASSPSPAAEFDALVEKLRPVYRKWQPALPDHASGGGVHQPANNQA